MLTARLDSVSCIGYVAFPGSPRHRGNFMKISKKQTGRGHRICAAYDSATSGSCFLGLRHRAFL